MFLSRNDVSFFNKDQLDITNSDQIKKLIKKNKPDLIINAAAYTAVDRAEDDKDMSSLVNSLALKLISDICFEEKIILIHFSTDYVFDGTKDSAYLETDKTNPKSVYGATKLEGEKHIVNSGCQYFIIRTSWVYSEFGSNFLKTIIKLSRDSNEIRVVNDQYGCPTYAREIAKGIVKMLPKINSKELNGIYHFAGPEKCSWFDFAKKILMQRNSDFDISRLIKINTKEYPTAAKRPKNSELDSSKFNKTFNFNSDKLNISIAKVLTILNN